MKPKILFVDDEQNILDSLRLLLRAKRTEWDMSFAAGGAAALDLLAATPHDVVVSDMRMPGMDGAQLLAEVQRRHPETVRMILSGYSEQDSVMRTVKLAHQYLSKPCPPEELKAAITRALRLRAAILSPELRRVVARLDTLPALPPMYARLTKALADEGASLQAIGDIIAQDMGMSAGILRLVNSAFFGLPVRVTGVHHAVKLLGTETIRALALSIHLFGTLDPGRMPGFDLQLLWAHSARVSCFARAVAELEGLPQGERDDCFIAGMLHDVGMLVLACGLGPDYAHALDLARLRGRRVHEAEREVLGATHAEVGAYLLSLWGFPDSIVEAVCWHHDPERVLCGEFSTLTAVAAANAFDMEQSARALAAPAAPEQPKDAPGHEIPCIGRDEYLDLLRDWRSICERSVAAAD